MFEEAAKDGDVEPTATTGSSTAASGEGPSGEGNEAPDGQRPGEAGAGGDHIEAGGEENEQTRSKPKAKRKQARKKKKQVTASNDPAAETPSPTNVNDPAAETPAPTAASHNPDGNGNPAEQAPSRAPVPPHDTPLPNPTPLDRGVEWLAIPPGGAGDAHAQALSMLMMESEVAIQKKKEKEDAEMLEVVNAGAQPNEKGEIEGGSGSPRFQGLLLPENTDETGENVEAAKTPVEGEESVEGGGEEGGSGSDNPLKRRSVDNPDNPDAPGSEDGGGRSKRVRKGNWQIGDWVEPGRQYLLSNEEDLEWIACVNRWFEFESVIPNPSGARLGAASARPAELSRWLLTRRLGSIPVLASVPAFREQWMAWWGALQPAGRKPIENGTLPPPLKGREEGMMVLKRSGTFGLYIVMIGLKWWGSEKDKDEGWRAAVRDLRDCLDHFVG